MKSLRQYFHVSARGSTLVAVLVVVAVLSVVCASVMETVTQEFLFSRSTLTWNQALFTAETGIEVGWNQMNKLTGLNTNGTFMLGWTYQGTNTWALTNQTLVGLMGSEGNSTYSITVITNSPTGCATITASGASTVARTGNPLTRRVEVILSPVTPFKWAMLAKGLIDFNGNSANLDSFNSASGAWTTLGQRRHGNIGTNGQLIDAAGLDLYGSAQTGPGGVVTTAAGFNQFQPASPDTGTNSISDGLRVNIPDALLPSGLAGLTSGGTINNDLTINVSGNQQLKYSSLSLTGNKTVTIAGSGKVQIYLTGNFSVGGTSQILLSPTTPGALTVEFYCAGTVDIGGTGIVNNQKAQNLSIYGLPSCTSVDIGGSAAFIGAIYAPQAAFTLHGGEVIYGAIVGNTINAVGTLDFHYDEALGSMGQVTYYTLTRWREL